MKRFFAMLIAFLLYFQVSAYAMTGTGYPLPVEGAQLADQMAANFDGFSALLELDAAEEYSGIADGTIQACFFSFNESKDHYLELYLMIPETVNAGDVITQDSDTAGALATTGIFLYEVNTSDNSDTTWIASSIQGIPYPAESGFTVTIEAAETIGNYIRIAGTVNAALYQLNSDYSAGDKLSITESHFDFTMSRDAQPKNTQEPDSGNVPGETASPEAAATPYPKEYVRI